MAKYVALIFLLTAAISVLAAFCFGAGMSILLKREKDYTGYHRMWATYLGASREGSSFRYVRFVDLHGNTYLAREDFHDGLWGSAARRYLPNVGDPVQIWFWDDLDFFARMDPYEQDGVSCIGFFHFCDGRIYQPIRNAKLRRAILLLMMGTAVISAGIFLVVLSLSSL